MKLSQQTLAILKNFSQINANLMVRSGNKLETISNATNIVASAEIEETFESDFGIYDLGEFLSAFSLLEDPDLAFENSAVVLSSGKSKIHYRFADESILTFPTKKVNMPKTEFTLDITREILSSISKAASALGHPICSVTNDGKNISLTVKDPKNPTANIFSTVVAEYTGTATFDLQIPIANLKVIPGDYSVAFCSKAISHWTNSNLPISYFIALETTSTFNS